MVGTPTHIDGSALRRAASHLHSQAHIAVKMLMCRLHEVRAPQHALVTDPDFHRLVGEAQAALVGGQHGHPYGLLDRLRAWQSLNPAFDDLMVLLPDGQVLARLESPLENRATLAPQTVASQPWFARAWIDGACEHAGPCILRPGRAATLIHVLRIDAPEPEGADPAARPLALLVFSFNLADQSQRIFRSLQGPNDRALLAVVDDQHRVIASSSDWVLPAGMDLHSCADHGSIGEHAQVVELFGRKWLSVSGGFWRHHHGPSFGPGWMGHALMPLEESSSLPTQRAPRAAAPWRSSSRVRPGLLAASTA